MSSNRTSFWGFRKELLTDETKYYFANIQETPLYKSNCCQAIHDFCWNCLAFIHV